MCTELRVDSASSQCSSRDFQVHKYTNNLIFNILILNNYNNSFGIQSKGAFVGTEQQGQRL